MLDMLIMLFQKHNGEGPSSTGSRRCTRRNAERHRVYTADYLIYRSSHTIQSPRDAETLEADGLEGSS